MLIKEQQTLSRSRCLILATEIWRPWTKSISAPPADATCVESRTAACSRCHGVRFRSRAFVTKLPHKHKTRHQRTGRVARWRRQTGCTASAAYLFGAFLNWFEGHHHRYWAVSFEHLLQGCSARIVLPISTHLHTSSKSHLGPKSQGFVHPLLFRLPQLVLSRRTENKGEIEPRAESLRRRLSGSTWHMLSVEKPRHESFYCLSPVLADTRVPALLTCDISHHSCSLIEAFEGSADPLPPQPRKPGSCHLATGCPSCAQHYLTAAV